MISIYKTVSETGNSLQQLDSIEPGCWINMVSPSEQEVLLISKKTGVPIEFLNAALDEEESSRIDSEDNNLLFIVDIPFTEMEENSLTYDTYPLGIIHTQKEIITVCLKNSKLLNDFIEGNIRSFFTFKRSRFILQILYRVSSYFLLSLRQIEKKSLMIQKKLHSSVSNKVLMQLLSLQNSLVYFSTSLKANEITLEKMLKLEIMQKYEEDKDILEDVIIEIKQAIEMTGIYANILNATMEASANVISNNLNLVMKLLASVTIVMSIPNIYSGLFGMNVTGLPWSDAANGHGFAIVLSMTLITVIATIIILNKRDMF
ncbi:CorA-like Mg2+ transporter protein [Clostridium homopropionicum DSM 5847]|uniref:CorA-like Mg2+ transporter protein n=1 Tax=Clostridium homopropionicum DSM 5847 TaxID=1121318 RepID=A0A0L6Z7Z0_9CLOT|nr:magnesium transporter CorA family protein [Clostridium homopropionicum]KOA19087.1 CorA-like Mg2+ transporter protein [Clostridium homopropionicum DSM 5847]SFG83306.1 magnesium transporter [Clostridium homopropionicum]